MKETIYTYVPLSRANRRANLHQILHRPHHQLREGSYYKHDPANPIPGPWVPQTPKPKWVTGEKALCNIKYPDMWLNLIKFFSDSTGPRLVSDKVNATR